jgi:SulP family sulfate permease
VGLPKVKTFRSSDAALEYAEDKLLHALGWRPPQGSQRVPLEDNNLCVDLNQKTIKALSTVLRPLNLSRKEKVFIQGDHGEEIYIVLKGEVETRLPTGRYHYKRTSKIGAGGYFGTLSFLRPGPRSTTAIVTRKAQLLVLDRAALQTLEQRGEHEAALSILESITKTVACQLRWARQELVRLESG